MALKVQISSAKQVTRPIEVEVPVEAEEGGVAGEGGVAVTEKVTQQEHVGWDIAVNIKGKWGATSTSFFISDLPASATEKDFVAWVQAKYKEAQGK